MVTDIERKLRALKGLAEIYCSEDVVDYHLGVMSYVLAEPPRTPEETDLCRILAAYFGFISDSEGITLGCSILPCFAAEVMLRQYRKSAELEEALFFAFDDKKWRRPRKSWSPTAKAYFRELQKHVPSRLWDLRGINVNTFADLMLPKLQAEGRVDASGELRTKQLN